ncbi:MAG: site-2 protease family protein [Firmicutes bacterium]|nr:site-2 protease family protein [Bacillota bacterium]
MREKFQNLFRNVNPAIIIILVVLIGNNLMRSSMSLSDWLYVKLLMLPGIVVGLTFHEAAHGYVSYWLGDPTPKLQGRLSLNPARHLDPVGFLALFIAGFGWGEPVQINPAYYKHRRRDEFLVSIAGVATNFIIAMITGLIMKAVLANASYSFIAGMGGIILDILNYMFMVNIVLMVFNLLPVPPLDGFGILTQIFNLQQYNWYWKLYQNGFLILMILIIFDITDMIISPCYGFFFSLFFS